jgi:mannose-6-phosphate isomerase-like protein (cupin superfamily)
VDAWSLDEVDAARRGDGALFHEFLRVPALSAGLYVLDAGAADPQSPHGEDEIYHVLAGRAWISVAGDQREVRPGDTVYVPALVEHRFHSISEPLHLLVVFAPAESD